MVKKMVHNKKGQALSLNTIIIAVIVVVVLIVVVSFFLFGFKGLTDRVKSIFFGTTAGTDRVLAIQQCENFCGQLDILPRSAISNSPYCDFSFNIDRDNDGEADKIGDNYLNFYCFPGANTQKPSPADSLDVDCLIKIGEETVNAATLCQ